MDGLGEELLAGAAFTADHDGDAPRCHTPGDLPGLADGGAAAHDIRKGIAGPDGFWVFFADAG